MPEDWIALDGEARRINWLWTGYLTAVHIGAGTAFLLTSRAPFWWVAFTAICWLVTTGYMVNRGYGRTHLLPDKIVLHSMGRHKSIPWAEVSQIERWRHQGRSSEWWDLRLIRSQGRPLAVPGIFTSKRFDDRFDANLALIQEYWNRANKPAA
jgi:hypothetical protein